MADQIDFPSSQIVEKDPVSVKFSSGKILKKQAKKGISRHFLKNVDQKTALFRRALLPQNKYILAPKALLENF